jgi:CheY-like chemotaxis protein
MTNFDGVNALIIEDNPSDAKVLQTLLGRLGAAYRTMSGHTFMKSLENVPIPSIVFLDLEMPGFDGYEVLQQLQAMPDFAQVPVVACTAHASEMSAARRAGFHSFLGKPLESAEFADQLAAILKGEPVWEVR